MADHNTVDDRRTAPKGSVRKGIHIILIAGITVFMMSVILFVNLRNGGKDSVAVTQAPAAALSSAPESATERVKGFQDLMVDAASRLLKPEPTTLAAPNQNPILAGQPTTAPTSATGNQDPIVAARKQREYESLFASNVVSSRRTGARQWAGTPTADGSHARGGDPNRMPSVDDIAGAVVRASGANATPGVPPGLQPASAPAPSPAPDHSGPVTANGPLHRVLESTYIDTVLTNRLDGSSESPVNVMVTEPLYSHNGDHVLIPAGSRLIGQTKPVQSLGEARLAVLFHRLLLPDGSTRNLADFKALNIAGDTGLHDQVNRHLLSTFGAAAAVGAISGLSQNIGYGAGGGNGNRTVVVAGNMGTETSQASSQIMNQFLNRLPTVTIREGHRVKVYITHDLELPAWVPIADRR